MRERPHGPVWQRVPGGRVDQSPRSPIESPLVRVLNTRILRAGAAPKHLSPLFPLLLRQVRNAGNCMWCNGEGFRWAVDWDRLRGIQVPFGAQASLIKPARQRHVMSRSERAPNGTM